MQKTNLACFKYFGCRYIITSIRFADIINITKSHDFFLQECFNIYTSLWSMKMNMECQNTMTAWQTKSHRDIKSPCDLCRSCYDRKKRTFHTGVSRQPDITVHATSPRELSFIYRHIHLHILLLQEHLKDVSTLIWYDIY